jgi:hypothetical protein
MQSRGIKIVAIRPTIGCWKKHLKILTKEQLYQFHTTYDIDIENNIVRKKDLLPETFYTQLEPLISISAIVGKNGTGKSTIIELILKAINNIACLSKKIQTDLKWIAGLNLDLYYDAGTIYKVSLAYNDIKIYRYDATGKAKEVTSSSSILQDFFYTIAVNYSHYAYNSLEFGDDSAWIARLFHKNDGYQTPLVINPMRNNGDIDINNESHLVRSRLIAMLVPPEFAKAFQLNKLSEHYTALYLKLTPQKSSRNKVLYELANGKRNTIEKVSIKSLSDLDEETILKELNRIYPFNLYKLDREKFKLAIDYIIYKIISIALKYNDYTHYFNKANKKFKEGSIPSYLKKLMSDSSHITFKLRQTLNYLKYQHIALDEQKIEFADLSERIAVITNRRLKTKLRAIDLIPPPIFKVDIILRNDLYPSEEIEFETLSSGQKQMIYSVSSLLYHLINLDSVKRSSSKRVFYRYINIILEEIELYFHPDMQRSYIQTIIHGIETLKLENIKGINICFVTHSPFVLSDIPHCNILFLDEDGKPNLQNTNIKTFGGNIHTLLSHSFFLNKGLIGEFAREKIEKCIRQLNNPKDQNSIVSPIELKIMISLIGEPFLRDKLMDMFYEIFSDKIDKRKEINMLKARIKILENDSVALK